MLQVACPLEFDPELHVYRLRGVIVPSVTTVLRRTGYINLDDVRDDVLEAARERGRRVHTALHYLLEGDLDLSTVDEQERGYVESAQAYLSVHVRRPIRMECRLWSDRYAVAGTADLIALHEDGYVSIDDFKTGNPDDVAADLQTAAYLGMALEMAQRDRNFWLDLYGGDTARQVKRRSIRLFSDGRQAVETPYHNYHDYARFLNALTVVHDQMKRPAPMAWDEER